MRKLSFALSLLMLLSCFSFSAFAVEDTDTMRWERLPDANGGGYPRMAQRADGTLLLTTGSGIILHSTDKGRTWTKQTQRAISGDPATATVTKDGTEYTFSGLTRANLQPFVVSDGTVLLGYRCHTNSSSDEYKETKQFYTSIRVLSSADGGVTFPSDSMEILVEDVNLTTTNGYWEPFFVQVDENTVLCYYADDLNVDTLGDQQRIAYVEYDVATKTWNKEPKVAYYRTAASGKIDSRDGMPMVTKLIDGSYAMVLEVHDYQSDNEVVVKEGMFSFLNEYANCVFVVGVLLSKDGRTWTDPVPVLAPTDLTAGNRCSAPSIATLPDGRIIITCQTNEYYSGYDVTNADNKCVMAVAISNEAVTYDGGITPINPISPKADGAAEGFTRLDVFTFEENEYSIWNSAFNCGNDIYLLGGAALNAEDSTTVKDSGHTHIARITAFRNAEEAASYDDAIARAGDGATFAAYGTPENGTVTLGVPAVVGGATPHVYRMDGGVYLTKMDVTVEDGVMTFEDNGGYYVVSDSELVTYGDSNKDGSVSIKDVIRMARHVVGTAEGTDVAASDMNGSLSITTEDILELARTLLMK